jgi:CTP synthase (UTP-ammonia lyase)
MRVSVGVIGDFNPASRSHRATDAALGHAARALGIPVSVLWWPTERLANVDVESTLAACDGVWIAPGSPYESLPGALGAIRFARERDWPLVAT